MQSLADRPRSSQRSAAGWPSPHPGRHQRRSESEQQDRVASLARRARLGSADAFAALYTECRGGVRAAAKRLLRDDDAADEATQQTFLYAFRALGRYDESRGAFPAWLNVIATNVALNALRKRKRDDLPRDRDAQVAWLEAPPPSLDFLADHGFRAMLTPLTRDQRAVIVLRYHFGWSIREIAEQLACSPPAAAQLHRRALERLRSSIPAREPARF